MHPGQWTLAIQKETGLGGKGRPVGAMLVRVEYDVPAPHQASAAEDLPEWSKEAEVKEAGVSVNCEHKDRPAAAMTGPQASTSYVLPARPGATQTP